MRRMKLKGTAWLLMLAGNLCVGNEAREADWRLYGYTIEEGREWFSLRGPGGEAWWVSEDRPGPVVVKSYDVETATLVAVIDGSTRRLKMENASIGESVMVSSENLLLAETVLAAFPPLPLVEGTDRPDRAKFAAAVMRIQAGVAADRLERAQTLPSVQPTQSDSPGAAAKVEVDQRKERLSPGAPDWAAIYRRVAERRAEMAAREALEKARRAAAAQ